MLPYTNLPHPEERPGGARLEGRYSLVQSGSRYRASITAGWLLRAVVLLGAAFLAASAWVGGEAAMQIQPLAGASVVDAWMVEDHAVPLVTLRFAFPVGAPLHPTVQVIHSATVAA